MGTGLGLRITHNVISRHDGRIEVESPPGEGTCFIVTLPAKVAAPSSRAGLPPSRIRRRTART